MFNVLESQRFMRTSFFELYIFTRKYTQRREFADFSRDRPIKTIAPQKSDVGFPSRISLSHSVRYWKIHVILLYHLHHYCLTLMNFQSNGDFL